VAARYGLITTNQVKQRILWNNLKAVIIHLYDHADPANRDLLQRYESEWRSAELEENKTIRKT